MFYTIRKVQPIAMEREDISNNDDTSRPDTQIFYAQPKKAGFYVSKTNSGQACNRSARR